MDNKNQQLTSIQALRAIAALLVLVFHLCRGGEKYFGGSPLMLFRYGYLGVDMFFVISGFIITYISYPFLGKTAHIPTYLYRRAVRIYPVYWQFSLAALVMYMLQPMWVNSAHTTEPDILRSFLLLPQESTLLLMVGWSLVFEVFFYLLFALCFLLPKRCFPLLLFGWAGYISHGIAYDLPHGIDRYTELLRSPHCLCFIAGCAAAILLRQKTQLPPRATLMTGAVGCIILMPLRAMQYIDNTTAILLFGTASAALVYGSVPLEQCRRLHTPRWLTRLGDASYSLYLLHPLVIAACGRAVQAIVGESLMANILFILTAFSFSIAGALLNYRYIEKPLLEKLKR